MKGPQGLCELGGCETERQGGKPCIAGVGKCLLRVERDIGLGVCAGIGLVIDVEVAATKDSRRGCDEILLERREEQQWFEDGTGSVGGLWVAMDCENSAGLLVKDGCICCRVLEYVSENGLFGCGISGKRVADSW